MANQYPQSRTSQQSSQERSLLNRMAEQYNIRNCDFLNAAKLALVGPNDANRISDAALIGLLIVCDQYKLDPFTKQIWAYPNKGSFVPMISLDGWVRIANRNPAYGGLEFRWSDNRIRLPGAAVECPEFCECIVTRKDMPNPIKAMAFADECFMPASPAWKQRPKHMLMLKALKLGVRIAFGISGLYDEDDKQMLADIATYNERQSVCAPPKASVTPAGMERTIRKLTDMFHQSGWDAVQAFVSTHIPPKDRNEVMARMEGIARAAEKPISDDDFDSAPPATDAGSAEPPPEQDPFPPEYEEVA